MADWLAGWVVGMLICDREMRGVCLLEMLERDEGMREGRETGERSMERSTGDRVSKRERERKKERKKERE